MHPMLNVAVRAARKAGRIINRASLDIDQVKIARKQRNDFVTEVDHAAEQAIIETLLTAFPGHSILAEESGHTPAKGAVARFDHIGARRQPCSEYIDDISTGNFFTVQRDTDRGAGFHHGNGPGAGQTGLCT